MKLANFSRSAFVLGGAVISWSTSIGADAFTHLLGNQIQRSTLRAAPRSDALSPLPASPKPIKRKRDRTQGSEKASVVVTVQQSQMNDPDRIPSVTRIMAGMTENPQSSATAKASCSTRLPLQTGDEKVLRRHGARSIPLGRKNRLGTRVVDISEPSSVPRPRTSAAQTQTVSREPWRAPYQVSMATQTKLKDTAVRMIGRPEEERSRAILLALVNTPPERVNEANVVCTLTLSAKCMTVNMKPSNEQRRLLFLVLDILKIMVERGQLGARQLCNAIYAIAKHYSKDNSILPAPPVSTAMSSNEMIGVAEAWILQDQDEDTPRHRLVSTIEMIANSLTASLEDEKKHGPRKPSVGEVSMACWAYGVLRQRVRPPGWVVPPQLSRLPTNRKPRSAIKNVQLVTFEQWAVNSDDSEAVFISNPVGVLFDAIGNFLCEERHESESSTFVEDMSWSEMANVAWAFSNHGHCRTKSSERLLGTLAQEATNRIQRASERNAPPFLPRDISQLVWSIGTLQSDNFRLGDDLARLIDATAIHYLLGASGDRPLQAWSSADLVQLAIALAHGRIDHLQLLRALYEEANIRISHNLAKGSKSSAESANYFQEWEVSVLLWVQARLYLKEDQGQAFGAFVQDSTRWLVQRAEEAASLEKLGIGAQEQANLAWSLTVLEAYQSPYTLRLLKAIFKETSTAGTKTEFIQLEHAHQLWQALYLMEYEWPEAVESVPSWFRDFLKEKWSVEKARHKISSARHRSLSKTLDLMGVAHFNEHDEDIDVAIVLKENSSWTNSAKKADHNHSHFKVGMSVCTFFLIDFWHCLTQLPNSAVEFDGPLHFTRETFDELGNKIPIRTLGHTALKYRLLKRQGWAVVRVPFYEFDKIPFWASMERQRYLQRLLKTHGNIRFSEVDVSEYKAIAPNRRSRFD